MAEHTLSKDLSESKRLAIMDAADEAETMASWRSKARPAEFVGVAAVVGWFFWNGASVWLALLVLFISLIPIVMLDLFAWAKRRESEMKADLMLRQIQEIPDEAD